MVCCRSSLVRLQLVLELLHERRVGSRSPRRRRERRPVAAVSRFVFERHQPQALELRVGGIERLDRHLHARERAATAHLDAGDDDPLIAADGFLDGSAQLGAQPAARLRDEVLRRQTARLREVVVGPAVEVEDLTAAVDDHARRRVALRAAGAAPAPPAGPESADSAVARARDGRGGCGGDGKLELVVARRPDAAVDPPLRRTPPRTGPLAARYPRRCPGTGSRLRPGRSAAAG